jgi:hypothetical protein
MRPSIRRFAPCRRLPTTTEIQCRKRADPAVRHTSEVVPPLRCPTPRVARRHPSPVRRAVPSLLEPKTAPARPPLISTAAASRLSRTHRGEYPLPRPHLLILLPFRLPANPLPKPDALEATSAAPRRLIRVSSTDGSSVNSGGLRW